VALDSGMGGSIFRRGGSENAVAWLSLGILFTAMIFHIDRFIFAENMPLSVKDARHKCKERTYSR